jgi:hypothetical protein
MPGEMSDEIVATQRRSQGNFWTAVNWRAKFSVALLSWRNAAMYFVSAIFISGLEVRF